MSGRGKPCSVSAAEHAPIPGVSPKSRIYLINAAVRQGARDTVREEIQIDGSSSRDSVIFDHAVW